MIIFKHDPAFVRWLEKCDVVFDESEDAETLLHEYLKLIPAVFPEIINSDLYLIYAYDMLDQKDDIFNNTDRLRESDAIAWRDCATICGKTRDLFAIGVSDQALICGQDYVVLCFLHEWSHILLWETGHGGIFHETLDELIDRWNRTTGAKIQNDYFGRNTDD